MRAFRALVFVAAAGLAATAALTRGERVPVLAGTVRNADGSPAAGVIVTARREGAPFTHSVIAGTDGSYRFPEVAAGAWTLAAGWGAATGPDATVELADGVARVELEAPARATSADALPSSSLLALLPDGEEKRRFVRDCTGCHVFDARIAYPEGRARSAASWVERTTQMLGFAGPSSGFPVIGAGREAEATASFLTEHVRDGATFGASPVADAGAAGALITEYPIPAPADLPHDVAVLADGRVIITGMFTHRMYVLDAETGAITTEDIPVPSANPRAVEVDAAGNWWVVLGAANAIARRAPDGSWAHWPVGTYAHSLGVGADGRVWFNGHFSRNPEILGFVEPGAGRVERVGMPEHPEAHIGAGPIPYELRVAPDGRVWGSELVGDRVYAYDPQAGTFETWRMPEPHSAPRRLDIGPDGMVWIPEYSGGRLTRLDPRTGEFTRIPLPIRDAAPYVARVDAQSGRVWLGTGAADAILAWDPAPGRWTTYPLPSRHTLVRHLAIDARNGDLWIAYGASPGPPSKVARLRAPD